VQVLVVNLHLDGITEAEYYRMCDELAPVFAEVPGLVSKVWLADPASNSYGGIYTFADREANVLRHLASPLRSAPLRYGVQRAAFGSRIPTWHPARRSGGGWAPCATLDPCTPGRREALLGGSASCKSSARMSMRLRTAPAGP
jgi:Putative mono-oxygenase ydhR